MKILPAIDLKNGKCVRLSMGDYNQVTSYPSSPVELATNWIDKGIKHLHIVDLDGAREGDLSNFNIINKIKKSLPETFIQVGGGIRKQDDIKRYIDIGINKVIVGTKALSDKEFIVNLDKDLKEQVIIDIAIKDNNLAIHGWNESAKLSIEEFLNYLENNNIKEAVLTDVSKDGMLSGTNLDLIKKICDLTHIPIIASGGISSLADIKSIISIMDKGVSGLIIGKAIYEKLIAIEEIVQLEENYGLS